MYRVDKFYGPDRQVLENISLVLPARREDRRARAERRRQVDAAAHHGRPRRALLAASPSSPPGLRVGHLSQEPELDPGKDVRGNVEDGVRALRDLLDRFNELSAKFAEPMRDIDALLEEQGQAAGPDRPPRRVEPRPALDTRDGRAALPARRPGRRQRSRAASGGAWRSAGSSSPRPTCCCSTSRRTTSTPSRSPGSSASWHEYRGTVIAVTHDRYFLDNVAGWILELDRGRGIPFKGNYSSWLEQKEARLAAEEKQAARPPAHAAARARVGADRARTRARRSRRRASPPTSGCSPRSRASSSTRVEIHIPAGPAARATSSSRPTTSRKGFGDRLLIEDLTFTLPPGGIVGVIGPNGAGKTTLFRMIAGEEQPDAGALRIGDTVQLAYVDQSRAALDPAKTVWKEISGGQDMIMLGKREVNSRQYVSWFNFKGADQQKRVCRPLRRRAQPPPPREAPQIRRQRAAARRADERPRRRHAARARGGAARLRRAAPS